MNTKHTTAIFKIIFRIFIALFLLEALLRVQGFIYLAIQEKQNKSNLLQNDEYRILVLGGSLTTLGGEDAYPNQLTRILNESQTSIKFTVINKGIPAADSSIIVKNLVEDRLIKEYEPHIIVALMGFNDRVELVLFDEQNVLHKFMSFLEREVNVYKLFKELIKEKADLSKREDTKEKASDETQKISKEEVRLEDYYKGVSKKEKVSSLEALKLFKASELYRQNGEYEKAEKVLKYLLNVDINSEQKESVVRELAECFYSLRKYQDLMPLLEYFFMKNDRDLLAVDKVIFLCNQNEAEGIDRSIKLLLKLIKVKPQAVQFYTLLAACYLAKGEMNALSNI